jgi:hypothetical protein
VSGFSNPVASYGDVGSMHAKRENGIPLAIHSGLPLAAGYFFLNCAGLPLGLFYTTLFAPLIYLWLYLKGHRWLTLKFLAVLSPFILAHMAMGVASPEYYFRSLFVLWTVYIAVNGICRSLVEWGRTERLFEELICLNFFAAVLGVLSLPTPLRPLFWQDDSAVIAGVSHLLRLNLLSTEPSAYALLMLPLLVFAALRVFRQGSTRSVLYFVMIGFPFLLCQSFGGISMCVAGVGVALLVNYRRQLLRPKSLALAVCVAVVGGAILITPNPISARVMQVALGGDASTQARTVLSFIAANAVASTKSLVWGAGLGQGKLVDFSGLGIGFETSTIPNAVAGTYAELGIAGVLFRFGLEFFLFAKTKSYRSSFRTAMFVVAFITQLTGSYLTDVQEYVMWFFAFCPLFAEFETRFDAAGKVAPS